MEMKNIALLIPFSMVFFSCSSAPAVQEADFSFESNVSPKPEMSVNNNRMVTYSIAMELSVENTDETKGMLSDNVKNYNGFITRETENYITTRIPVENMDDFIKTVKTLGKVENENKTGTDITDQYRDNVIRLESLKSVRDRYLALLEKANAVNDILSIEKELERVNTEIEILEGKIKYAEQSVYYSNITIRFHEKAKPGPVGWIFYGLYHGIKWLFVWN
jgi:hypothetical protein